MGRKYLLPGVKVISETNIPGGLVTAILPPMMVPDKVKTKQISIMVKGIDNAFDHMELCLVLLSEVFSSVIGFYFTEISYTAEIFATYFFSRWQMGFSGVRFATRSEG